MNVLVGIVWQMTLIVAPIYLVIRRWDGLVVSLVIFAVTSIIMKYNWLDKIKDYEPI